MVNCSIIFDNIVYFCARRYIMTQDIGKSNDAVWYAMAATQRRGNETIDEAFNRIKSSKYIFHKVHNDLRDFLEIEPIHDKIFVGLNTAHDFYKKLYEPIKNQHEYDSDGEIIINDSPILVALELLLLSFASTVVKHDSELGLITKFLTEWSSSLAVMLR